MIIINYNPATQIPSICEKDIDNKIIISVFNDSNIFMATRKETSRFVWFGSSIRTWSLINLYTCGYGNSLINLLIRDYSECCGHVIFYVLEDIFDVEFITNKYNLRNVNIRLLEMLKGRASECFPR